MRWLSVFYLWSLSIPVVAGRFDIDNPDYYGGGSGGFLSYLAIGAIVAAVIFFGYLVMQWVDKNNFSTGKMYLWFYGVAFLVVIGVSIL